MKFRQMLSGMLGGTRKESADPRSPEALEKVKDAAHEALLNLARAHAPDYSGDMMRINASQHASTGDEFGSITQAPTFDAMRREADTSAMSWLLTATEPEWLVEERNKITTRISRAEALINQARGQK